jgi:hypothetical protein
VGTVCADIVNQSRSFRCLALLLIDDDHLFQFLELIYLNALMGVSMVPRQWLPLAEVQAKLKPYSFANSGPVRIGFKVSNSR